LLIFGEGRQQEELSNYGFELGCDAVFIGSIGNEDIPIALAASDCLCLSSLYEGLPTVAIEALASGIPIVSTKVGDMDKLIDEGFTGYFADENNYSEKLKLALNKSSSMKENCLRKASMYDMGRIGKLITEMYEIN
jgi:glycosyltransferase involved in cell wall biosynthesis